MRSLPAAIVGLLAATAFAQPAGEAETAIRGALAKWTADFNARDGSKVCDVFAPDLRYDYRGFPERNYETLCGLLRQSVSDTSKTYTYALDIKEIIVSGDLAIVRLIWTLKTTEAAAGRVLETKEPGLDVFRKQPDGQWKIVRFMAYEQP